MRPQAGSCGGKAGRGLAYLRDDDIWIFDRTAFLELVQAFKRLHGTAKAADLVASAQIVAKLRGEQALPAWDDFRRRVSALGGDVFVFETLYRRASSALNDPGACPSCGREKIATVSSIYTGGTQDVNTSGFGVGSAGGNTVVVRTSQSGTARTHLALTLRPYPEQQGGGCLIAWCVAFFVIPGFVGAIVDHEALSPLFLVWSAVGVIFIVIGAAKSGKAGRIEAGKPAAFEVWNRAWYCFTCEKVFFNFGQNPTGVKERHTIGTAEFRRLVWTAGGYADLA